jgi:Fe-S cluster biogenesis protein NfuA/nitrite reductase/ring-hydroxylating ferredoxin subunit
MAAVDDVVGRVQQLTEQLETFPDVRARQTTEELVSAILEMYGEGLAKVMELIDDESRAALCEDDLVAGLLLIHDLFPVPLEERVEQALDSVRPYMESHGGQVTLLGIEDAVVHLRLEGSCKSCQASSSTLELAVRQALERAAPDLEGMEVEGVVEEPGPAPSARTAEWVSIDVPATRLSAATAGEHALVIAEVDGTFLAFANHCADCGGPLDAGTLVEGALTCPACSRSYFLPRAGRSMDDDGLMLGPVPLLRENGSVKVAVA